VSTLNQAAATRATGASPAAIRRGMRVLGEPAASLARGPGPAAGRRP